MKRECKCSMPDVQKPTADEKKSQCKLGQLKTIAFTSPPLPLLLLHTNTQVYCCRL